MKYWLAMTSTHQTPCTNVPLDCLMCPQSLANLIRVFRLSETKMVDSGKIQVLCMMWKLGLSSKPNGMIPVLYCIGTYDTSEGLNHRYYIVSTPKKPQNFTNNILIVPRHLISGNSQVSQKISQKWSATNKNWATSPERRLPLLTNFVSLPSTASV